MRKHSPGFSVVEASGDDKDIFITDTVSQGISDGCAVILASDLEPREMTEKLEKSGMDAKRYVSQGVLTIIEKEFVYSIAQTQLKPDLVLKKWYSLISEIKAQSGCQCILAIGTAKMFLDSQNVEKLIAYEEKVGRNFGDMPLDALCCYEADSFSALELKDIIHILNHHEYTIYQGGIFLQWQPRMILTLLERAIDGALGSGTSKIMLKTLELIYHIDRNSIMHKPESFQSKLHKILGASSDVVIARIKTEITAELMYMRKIEDANRRN